MTISTTTILNSYSGNGSTTSFAYTFPINTTSEITYKVQWISQGTAYLNRSTSDTDNEQVHQVRTRSRVYGFEIGA